MGINCGSLSKILKCAANDDTIKLTAQEDGDTLNIRVSDEAEDRVSEFSMKLMEIDADPLGIPQQDYNASVTMPSSEFSRVCKDIANFGDTVQIEVDKSKVQFSASGDIGTGRMQLKATTEIDALLAPRPKKEKEEPKAEDTPKAEGGTPKKEETATKEETQVKTEKGEGEKAKEPKEDEAAEKAKEDTATASPKAEPKEGDAKSDADGTAEPPAKRGRKEKSDEEKKADEEKKKAEKDKKAKEQADKKEEKKWQEEEEERRKKLLQAVRIQCKEPVQLQFALRYLTMFAKAQSVCEVVTMKLARDTPMMMEYGIEVPVNKSADAPAGNANDERMGTLSYYLAPKVGDGDDEEAAAGGGAADDE